MNSRITTTFNDCVKRVALLAVVLCSFSVSAALHTVSLTRFVKWDDGKILWVGDGNSAWSTLQLERRGNFLWSNLLQMSGSLYPYDVSVPTNVSRDDVLAQLNTFDPDEWKYIDFGGDWSSGLVPLYPSGYVFTDSSGNPTEVVWYNPSSGDPHSIPVSLNPDTGFYESPPFVNQDGVTGRVRVSNYGDGPNGFVSSFVPNWGGGINSGSTPSTTTPFNPSSGYASSDPDYTPPDGGYTFEVPNTTTLGDSQNVVTYNTYNAGTANNPIYMKDYSSALNVIGSTLINHASTTADNLSTLNENLGTYFSIDDGGDLQVAPTDDTDYDVDTTEADQIVETVSGWGFNFGFDSNPVGDLFTRLVGNPPTSFGTQDTIWSIDIPIYGNVKLNSSFKLSDWFPPAFRSFILFVVTIFFAVACAKAISGAFQ